MRSAPLGSTRHPIVRGYPTGQHPLIVPKRRSLVLHSVLQSRLSWLPGIVAIVMLQGLALSSLHATMVIDGQLPNGGFCDYIESHGYGHWNAPTDTCVIDRDFTLYNCPGDLIVRNATLLVDDCHFNKLCPALFSIESTGQVTNRGRITDYGSTWNEGTLYNDGWVYLFSFFTNFGEVNNRWGAFFGATEMLNYGVINNRGDVELWLPAENRNVVYNLQGGHIKIRFGLLNDGTIDNQGVIRNHGKFVNKTAGAIRQAGSARIINKEALDHLSCYEGFISRSGHGAVLQNLGTIYHDGPTDLDVESNIVNCDCVINQGSIVRSSSAAVSGIIDNSPSHVHRVDDPTPPWWGSRMGLVSTTGVIENLGDNYWSGVIDNNRGEICLCNEGQIVGNAPFGNPPVWNLDWDGDGVCGDCDCAGGRDHTSGGDSGHFQSRNSWGVPSEVAGLMLTHAGGVDGVTTVTWTPPANLGGDLVDYDMIVSERAREFWTGATCMSIDGPTTEIQHSLSVPSGDVLFHLVRARNGCGGGTGGWWASGVRQVRGCPETDSLVDFDDVDVMGPYADVPGNRYQSDGIVFEQVIPLEKVQSAEPDWVEFVREGGSVPNAMCLSYGCTLAVLQIEATFVVPGTTIPAVTDFVQVDVFDRDVDTSLGTLQVFDAFGVLIDSRSMTTPESHHAVYGINEPGIARIRLIQDSDGGLFDNLMFGTPTQLTMEPYGPTSNRGAEHIKVTDDKAD